MEYAGLRRPSPIYHRQFSARANRPAKNRRQERSGPRVRDPRKWGPGAFGTDFLLAGSSTSSRAGAVEGIKTPRMKSDVGHVCPQNSRIGDPHPEHIAIVRALPGLGDMLCLVPALRALRAALPEAWITLIGLPWAQSFVTRFSHYLDQMIEFPGYPGIPERVPPIRKLPAFFSRMQEQPFDLVLQMHGNGTVINSFVALLGARHSAGFYLPGQYCPDPDRFLPYPAQEPEIWRHLRLMEFLGVPLQGEATEFPLRAEDEQALKQLDEVASLRPGEYVCIHPGAADPARRWPLHHFAAVADFLASQGLQVVLTGLEQEREITCGVEQAMCSQPINLAGRTNLGALATLLSGARLVVCNDTGISHLAAALRIPSIVVFTGSRAGSDPHRWAPLDRELHRVVCPSLAGDSTGPSLTAVAGEAPVAETRPSFSSTGTPCLEQQANTDGYRCLRDACLLPLHLEEAAPTGTVATEAVLAQAEDLLGKELCNE